MAKIDDLRRAKALKFLSECWTPHEGQKRVGEALFSSPADLCYVECGRKWGKSEFAVYTCWLYAILNKNAEVYYLAPQVDQVKELVWANYRMQSCNTYDNNFIPKMERILGGEIKVFNQDKRIVLPNGSFIKCHGSDNYNAQRGLKPDFVVGDEYRDFKPEWIEAVRPNMLVKKGKMLFITTPPHGPNQAYELAMECKEGMAEGDSSYFYINQPTITNNRIPGLDIEVKREEKRLKKAGRYNEYLREYQARYIVSDENAVIPQLNRELMIPHTEVTRQIHECRDTLSYHCVLNPGNSTTFAASYYAFNPYTGQVWLVDEMKLYDSNETNIAKVWPRVKEKLKEFNDDIGGKCPISDVEVLITPDKPWISRDLFDFDAVVTNMVTKEAKRSDFNVNLLKDICEAGRLIVSDRCGELIRESETYQRSRKTLKVPQSQNNLLLDNLRGVLSSMGYTNDLLTRPLSYTKDEIMNDPEVYMKRVKETKSFDEVCQEIRMEKFGILGDDDDVLFGEDTDQEMW